MCQTQHFSRCILSIVYINSLYRRVISEGFYWGVLNPLSEGYSLTRIKTQIHITQSIHRNTGAISGTKGGLC